MVKINIIDNSNIKEIKIFSNKIKLCRVYKGIIKKYSKKKFNCKYNSISNVLIVNKKQHVTNSFNKIRLYYNNNSGLILNNNFNPISTKVSGILDINLFNKNLKLIYLNVNEKI